MPLSQKLIRWFFILLASVIFSITLNTNSQLSPNYLLINQALAISIISYLLLPIPKNPGHLLTNLLVTLLLLVVLTQLTSSKLLPAPILGHLCLVTLCLLLFLWSLSQVLQTLFPHILRFHLYILFLMATISSMPIWLAPWVDLYLPENHIINSIISITPLTHVSVAAQYDYLRSEWFYQNSPFGSLPFTYPDLISIVSSYLVLAALLQVLLWKLKRKDTSSIQSTQSLNIS